MGGTEAGPAGSPPPPGRGRGRQGCRSRSTAAASRLDDGRGTGVTARVEHPPQRRGPPGRRPWRPQRRRPPDPEQVLVAAAVVDHQDAVVGQPGPELGDERRGEERQVAGEQRHDVGGHLGAGRPAARRPGRRPAAARGPGGRPCGTGWRRADDDPLRRRRRRRPAPRRASCGRRPRAAAWPGRPAAPPCRRPARRPCTASPVPRRHRRSDGVGTVLRVGRVTSRTPVLRIRGAQHTTRPGHGRRGGAAGDPAGRHPARGHDAHARATTSTWCTASSPPRG